jgi:hypothetical protein
MPTSKPNTGAGKNKPKTVNFRCSEDLWAWVRGKALRERTSVQAYCTGLLERERAREGRGKAA